MATRFTGGCICGGVRYECAADPIAAGNCHCRDCQQVTGGGFVPGLLVPAPAFRLTKGQLRYHFPTYQAAVDAFSPYFTHVFNAWTQMPTVNEQMALEGSFTADFFASRDCFGKVV